MKISTLSQHDVGWWSQYPGSMMNLFVPNSFGNSRMFEVDRINTPKNAAVRSPALRSEIKDLRVPKGLINSQMRIHLIATHRLRFTTLQVLLITSRPTSSRYEGKTTKWQFEFDDEGTTTK